jgi:prepilin-type N-terminal cleavage/methylation domain-containing protein
MNKVKLRDRKKRAFTLLELMIALGLTAILLSLLFRFFAGSVRVDRKISDARLVLNQRQQLQIRLTRLFTSIVPRSSMPPSDISSFYTLNEKTASLVAIFDNGIDPDPLFSGPVLGKLFIDEQSNLTLALWPLDKKENHLYRTEMLLPHVQNMHFQFLAKKGLQENDPTSIPINASLEWRFNWPKNRWDIPSIIRVVIQQERQEIGFAFMLPFIEPIATFHETGVAG